MQGQFVPTPVVDLTTYGKVTFDPPPYMQPGSRRVDTPVNKTIRYWALGLTLANLDSTWDSTLDISNYLNVTQKGAIDDVTYDASMPVKEFMHPQTGQVYRAAQFDAAPASSRSPACRPLPGAARPAPAGPAWDRSPSLSLSAS